MKVLIIEDNNKIVEMLELILKISWPLAIVLSSRLGAEGVALAEKSKPTLIILDLGLPDMDGLDVLRQIRTFSHTPIIILTARKQETDIVEGLESGAAEYIVKPFRQMELLSRIRCVMRRRYNDTDEMPMIFGPLNYMPSRRRLVCYGKEVYLTATESHILESLIKNAGRTVTIAALAEKIWGEKHPHDENAVRVYIRRLREKLESDPSNPQMIMTRPGIGYYLEKGR